VPVPTTRARLAVVAAVAVAGLMLAGAPSAVANPSIAEVEAQLEALHTEAEMASENLNGAQVRLEKVRAKQEQTRVRADRARTALADQARDLGAEVVGHDASDVVGLDQAVEEGGVQHADDPIGRHGRCGPLRPCERSPVAPSAPSAQRRAGW